MYIFDGYYILFIVSICVLILSLVHSTRILKHIPDHLVLIVMTSVVVVCAYNYEMGNYIASARIQNGGYFLLAILAVIFFIYFLSNAAISLIGLAAILIFFGAGAVGGVNYGSAWLYNTINLQMSQNTFLIILISALCLTILIWWKLNQSIYFKWLLSFILISISNAFAFSCIVGRINGWLQNSGDTYEILNFTYIGIYITFGFLWYIIPSYITFKPNKNNETQPLLSSSIKKQSLLSKSL
jgi:hypothetical protein